LSNVKANIGARYIEEEFNPIQAGGRAKMPLL
jgi:hypothetical protein